VITERDAEARRDEQYCEQREVEPINAEIPQVKRHCGECENKCANQERTRRPIDAARRNAENQRCDSDVGIVGLLISAENNVLLCPRMNAAAMGTGELLRFYSCRQPALFFYRPAGIGQL
jgi:hypothetical protein